MQLAWLLIASCHEHPPYWSSSTASRTCCGADLLHHTRVWFGVQAFVDARFLFFAWGLHEGKSLRAYSACMAVFCCIMLCSVLSFPASARGCYSLPMDWQAVR